MSTAVLRKTKQNFLLLKRERAASLLVLLRQARSGLRRISESLCVFMLSSGSSSLKVGRVLGHYGPLRYFRGLASYVSCDESELAVFLPEGLSGEVENEFHFTGKRKWMERDAGKVVKAWIDNHSRKGKAKQGIAEGEGSGAKINIYRYGANIMKDVSDETLVVEAFSGKLKLMEDDGLKGGKPDRVVLTGERGVGKSVILNQAVIHARKKGWLCLFVPNAFDHSHGGMYVEPLPGKSGLYDNTTMSASLLRGFYQAHRKEIDTIPIKDVALLEKYNKHITKFQGKWDLALKVPGREDLAFTDMRAIILGDDFDEDEYGPDRELLADFDFLSLQPKTLGDLVRMGLAFHDFSGAAVLDLVSELRELDQEGMPVLFAVDQMNTWEHMTPYQYRDHYLHARDIAVPKALSFVTRKKTTVEDWTMKNGLCLGATSFKHEPMKGWETYAASMSSIPLTIEVPVYSKAEFKAALEHYDLDTMTERSPSAQEIEAFRMSVGNNPLQMMRHITKYMYGLSADDAVADSMATREDEGLQEMEGLLEASNALLDSAIGDHAKKAGA